MQARAPVSGPTSLLILCVSACPSPSQASVSPSVQGPRLSPSLTFGGKEKGLVGSGDLPSLAQYVLL